MSRVKKIKEPPKPKTHPEVIQNRKYLIEKYLKPGLEINWGKELSVAKKLLENNPDIEFWRQFELPYKLNSLAFLLSERGQEAIFIEERKQEDEVKNAFLVSEMDKIIDNQPKQEYALESFKHGEDEEIKNKPKNLIEFLDNEY